MKKRLCWLLVAACSHPRSQQQMTMDMTMETTSPSGPAGPTMVMDTRPVGTGATKSQMVSNAVGATVQLENVTLRFPPGSLPQGQTELMVTITSTTTTPPDGFASVSPVYKFEPEGVQFELPVSVTLTYTGDVTTPAVYWSNLTGTGFDQLPTLIRTSGTAETAVLHFSSGFVAESQMMIDVPSNDVTGHRVVTYHRPAGNLVVPTDFSSATPPAALVPDGAGGFTVYPGTGGADGTFSIPNVPLGVYYFNYGGGGTYVGSARDIDLDQDLPGNPGASSRFITEPLLLTLDFTNFGPDWTPSDSTYGGDIVEMFALSSQAYEWVSNFGAPVPLGPTGPSCVWRFQIPNYPQGSYVDPHPIDLDDEVWFFRLSQQSSNVTGAFGATNRLYSAISGYTSVTDFAIAATGGVGVTGVIALTSVSGATNSQSPTIDFSSFLAHASEFGPTGLLTGGRMDVGAYVQPFGVSGQSSMGSTADIFAFTLFATDPLFGQTVTLNNLTYGNPYPPDWTQLVRISLMYVHHVNPPTGTGGFVRVSFDSELALDHLSDATVGLSLSAVHHPTINGADLFTDHENVGTTPTIAWDPPTVGEGPLYTVSFLPAGSDGDSTTVQQFTPAYTLSTTSTSATIPSGSLLPNRSYVVFIGATREVGFDPVSQPFKVGVPNYFSNIAGGWVHTTSAVPEAADISYPATASSGAVSTVTATNGRPFSTVIWSINNSGGQLFTAGTNVAADGTFNFSFTPGTDFSAGVTGPLEIDVLIDNSFGQVAASGVTQLL